MKQEDLFDNQYKKNSIMGWAFEDRPANKLLLQGRGSLSNVELLSIILRDGNKKENAVDVARTIMTANQNSIIRLATCSVRQLSRFNGIGKQKAAIILASLELGKRYKFDPGIHTEKISCSKDAYNILISRVQHLYEEFWIILLNRANRVVEVTRISEGGLSGTVADPRRIFKLALEHNASSVILAHNHPSGNTNPSESDIKLTNKIRDAGNYMDIQVLDHIILCNDGYYSFADDGVI